MKILLIAGHGNGDPGAVGNGYQEADLTREVVSSLANKLKAEVTLYPFERNAFEDDKNKNYAVDFGAFNYVFEVHFNAFNGSAKGTEIYVTREESKITVEENIMSKLSSLFVNRGVKRKNFNVIDEVKSRGVSSALIEVCFIDNVDDMATYVSKKDEVISAIADGINEGFGLTGEVTPVPVPEPALKSVSEIADEVIAGKWGNGSDRQARLESAGYNYSEVQAEVNRKLGVSTPTPTPQPTQSIVVGSRVKVKSGAKDYNGSGLASFVYSTVYSVMELKGDRAVIGNNGAVTCAINVNNLYLV